MLGTTSRRVFVAGRRTLVASVVPLVVVAAVASGASPVAAAGGAVAGRADAAAETAIVSLGDSFISGEAGRWLGNSNHFLESRDGTDRAYDPVTRTYDPRRVYGGSYQNRCDRSDVAEIHQARALVKVDHYLNLACSGATTSAISGKFKEEDPQGEQLAAAARTYDVTTIVLSIGGNDLKLFGVLRDCAEDFINPFGRPCTADGTLQQRIIDALPGVRDSISGAIQYIRSKMRGAGYADNDYRFVLQGYPSPLPDSRSMRYAEHVYDRYVVGGCPFYNADLDWFRGQMSGLVNDLLAKVAAATNVSFLDLRDTLAGREVCSTTTQRVVKDRHPVSLVTSEWSRFAPAIEQGDFEEAFHPNAIAQQALGYCLGLFVTSGARNARCVNTPGADYRAMKLLPTRFRPGGSPTA